LRLGRTVVIQRRQTTLCRSVLRATAIAFFAVYVAWNVYWLSHATVPPSLLKALTGLPAPTTGGTRSVRHILAGNWGESLRYNAMTLPIGLLLVTSLACLGWQGLRGRRLSLPTWMVWSWAAVLSIAWALKLCSDPRYW
jgi:hypothetical protein